MVNTRAKMLVLQVGAALALIAALAVASASLIGVQFRGNGTALTPTQTAGVIPQDNFNVVVGATGTNLPLNYADSTTAPVTLTYSADDVYTTGTGSSDANHTLLSGKVGTATGTATFTLSNVPDGQYNLVVYASNDTTSHHPELSAAGTTYAFNSQAGSSFDGTFISTTNTTIFTNVADYPVANYVEFANISPTAGQLVLTVSNVPGQYYGDINGLQLQSVPEPASLAMLGMGGAALLLRRRKQA